MQLTGLSLRLSLVWVSLNSSGSGRLKVIVELATDYKLDIDISADLIAKLMFHKENPTPPELHYSIEAPSPSTNGGSSGSTVGLQVPKRETKAFVNPSTNGRF
ncbi:unnamed protein product [Arabidopsis thaliana]|uniref:Uncharacterized protein n=1 Tax=Arabidopsis thaliana TaxID=3702 RepID=A0A654FM06_ARATH|nr:unnamed protein product [Arabidopsis thaliana]